MDLENLKEIVLIQSEIIRRLGRKHIDSLPPTQEKQEMFELLDELREKLKSI
ncbi:hypothetical protein [Flavobacterium sp.]|uniref:hypothetical protein n=1 Tax=Flavobacterium sp. TaxID=239 RepID=UPI0040489DB2